MLSYRHNYHAGNFADVVKHVALLGLLEALLRKPAALYVQDTHAGRGMYDLSEPELSRHAEFAGGVARILPHTDAPPLTTRYLQLIRGFNPSAQLQYYPGSPAIIQTLLRAQDRLLLTELHPQDYTALHDHLHRDKRIAIHKQDAYQGLKAFLPPRENRGLVFIDPPYERKDEYQRVVDGLELAVQRWRNGVYAIWYPMMSLRLHREFLADVVASGIRKILRAELLVQALGAEKHFAGCGLLMINPPWQLEAALQENLAWLCPVLAVNQDASWRVEWLVPE